MFSLTGATKSYGKKAALEDITVELPTDQFVFILGPSGSGKSTLLRLLGFVETPEKGEVSLDLVGVKYSSTEAARPWPRLTCVFQRQFLWPHLTLRQNIALPARANAVSDAGRRIDALIDEFGMREFVDRYPNEVSGGQAQRAAIVRALALNPDVILIDEAHGGLDLEQQAILNDHLLGLRGRKVGLIVVTHSLEFAQHYADKILVLEDGHIAEVGSRSILHAPKSRFLQTVMKSATKPG